MTGRRRLWAAAVLCGAAAIGCGGKSSSHPTGPGPSDPNTPAAPAVYDVDALGVPQLATSDYIDVGTIQRISRFRSAVGHETRDDFETCRSLKHYFQPKTSVDWSTVSIYSPVAGTVDATRMEAAGLQVVIRSTAQPAFTFTIFHLNPNVSLSPGTAVTSGQRLGTHIGTQTMSDIAVGVATPRGWKLISWFQVMTDSVFQGYAARGVPSRESAIITQAARDADPLTCSGETFTSFGSGAIPDWLTLSPMSSQPLPGQLSKESRHFRVVLPLRPSVRGRARFALEAREPCCSISRIARSSPSAPSRTTALGEVGRDGLDCGWRLASGSDLYRRDGSGITDTCASARNASPRRAAAD